LAENKNAALRDTNTAYEVLLMCKHASPTAMTSILRQVVNPPLNVAKSNSSRVQVAMNQRQLKEGLYVSATRMRNRVQTVVSQYDAGVHLKPAPVGYITDPLVECISYAVQERMQALIEQMLIKAKQRLDAAKEPYERHLVTTKVPKIALRKIRERAEREIDEDRMRELERASVPSGMGQRAQGVAANAQQQLAQLRAVWQERRLAETSSAALDLSMAQRGGVPKSLRYAGNGKIEVDDLIAVLETDKHLKKSSLLYSKYPKLEPELPKRNTYTNHQTRY
jgi:hypothetical protein